MMRFFIWKLYLTRVFRLAFGQASIRGIAWVNLSGFVLGAFAIMVVLATMNGFYEAIHRAVSVYAGDISVLSYTPISSERQTKVVKQLKDMYGQRVSPFGTTAALVSGRGHTRDGLLETFGDGLFEHCKNEGSPGVVLGEPFRDSGGVQEGDVVKLLLLLPSGIQTLHARVCAFTSVGFYEYDNKLVWMSQKFLYPYQEDLVFGAKIHLPYASLQQLNQEVLKLESMLGHGMVVFTWYERNQNLFDAIRTERKLVLWVIAFIVLVASFNLISHLYVHYSSRSEAFQLLYVLGERRFHMVLLAMLQGTWVGVLGSSVGVLLSYIGVLLVQGPLKIQIPMQIYNLSSLPLIFNWSVAGVVVLGSAVLAMLVSVIPALKTRELFNIGALQG